MTEVWAGMATLTERATSRSLAVNSLIGQVDRLTIMAGDELGDKAKFASCSQAPDVFFAVDDDLVYPADFVERTLDCLAEYPDAIVGYHGWSVDRDGELSENYRALETVDADHEVQVVATCACAFRTNTITVTLDDFPMQNADLWLAVKAALRGVRRVVLAHDESWFGYTPPARTMWDETQAKTGSSLDYSAAYRVAVEMLVELHHGVPA